MLYLLVSILACYLASVKSLYTGNFISSAWELDLSNFVERSTQIRFIVALKLRDVEKMKEEFLSVSNPKSKAYGKYLGELILI